MKVVVVKGRGIIAPFVVDGYINALKSEGHEVLVISIGSRKIDDKTAKLVKDFVPDTAMCYGSPHSILQTNSGFFFREIGVKLNVLFYDMPFFMTDDIIEKEFKEYNDFYNLFIWDSAFVDILKKYDYMNIFPIMLAADTTLFYPRNTLNKINETAFVGSLRVEDLSKKIGVDEIDAFIDHVIEIKVTNLDIPVFDIMKNLMSVNQYSLVKKLFEQNEKNFWKTIYFTIHAKGSAVVRYYLLNAYDFEKLNIFGSINWEKENTVFHRSAKYGTELSEIYERYSLNLNISSLQLENSVNNRVFDCFASKGFLLSDYRKDMEKIFPSIWREICFKNIEEMKLKSEYFLSHEKERKELTEEAYNNIIKGHTYIYRVREVLSRI